jgi:hypothetical protein
MAKVQLKNHRLSQRYGNKKMTDIYESPKSNLIVSEPADSIVSEVEALRELLKEENGISSTINSLLFTILSIIPFAMPQVSVPPLIMLFPAFVVGFIIKYSGCLIKLKYRLVSSLISASLIFFILAFENVLIAIGIATINFFICLVLSKRPLSPEQDRILYRWKIGKIRL